MSYKYYNFCDIPTKEELREINAKLDKLIKKLEKESGNK